MYTEILSIDISKAEPTQSQSTDELLIHKKCGLCRHQNSIWRKDWSIDTYYSVDILGK